MQKCVWEIVQKVGFLWPNNKFRPKRMVTLEKNEKFENICKVLSKMCEKNRE